MHKQLTAVVFALVLALTGITAAQEKTTQSDNALAYLTLDIEKTPGWVAKVKGGYQWKLFRNVGLDIDGIGAGHKKNFTKDGAAASISLGYNFGERFPLTIGLQFGLGPSGKMSQRTDLAGGGSLYSHQKVNIYALDLTADYDFRNCSRWTPFVGITAGAAFVSQRGHAEIADAAGAVTASGSMGKRRSVNFMTGARAGVKYDINDRLTLSLYGSYNYLGKVKSKEYMVGPNMARTSKITAHSVEVKAGLALRF